MDELCAFSASLLIKSFIFFGGGFNLSIFCLTNISSCECKKVVNDILVEIEIFTDDKSIGKMPHFEP